MRVLMKIGLQLAEQCHHERANLLSFLFLKKSMFLAFCSDCHVMKMHAVSVFGASSCPGINSGIKLKKWAAHIL